MMQGAGAAAMKPWMKAFLCIVITATMRRNASVHACIHQTRRSLSGSGLRKRVWKEGLCEIASSTDHGSNRRIIWLRACNNARGLIFFVHYIAESLSVSFTVCPHRFFLTRCAVVFVHTLTWGNSASRRKKSAMWRLYRYSLFLERILWFVCYLFNLKLN